MRVLLLEHLTIDDIHEEGRANIQNYSEFKMLRFLHLFQELCRKGYYYHEKTQIEIYSKKLQRISKDYVEYVSVLKKFQILKVNNYYIPEESCKSYSYTPIYTEKSAYYKINSSKVKSMVMVFNNDIINYKIIRKSRLEDRLNEFFCFLDFDIDSAITYSEELLEKRTINPDINPFGKIKKIYPKKGKPYYLRGPVPIDEEEQYDYETWLIDKWQNRFFDGHRDKTSYRLHSLLSRLPRNFKQFVKFKIADSESNSISLEKIYGLDIKNSQPFFSLVIMNPRFWYYPEMPDDLKKVYKQHFKEPEYPSLLNIKTIGMEKAFSKAIYTYILKSIDDLGEDHKAYKESVLSGQLYENIAQQYKDQLSISMQRDDIKTSLFTTFFSSNDFFKQKAARPKRLFSEVYPTVYDVFKSIKTDTNKFKSSRITDSPHKLLSIMLQRVESFMVLDVVTASLIKKYPDMPIYTVHDSICSTKKFMPAIRKEINLKMAEFTGLTPTLDQQEW